MQKSSLKRTDSDLVSLAALFRKGAERVSNMDEASYRERIDLLLFIQEKLLWLTEKQKTELTLLPMDILSLLGRLATLENN